MDQFATEAETIDVPHFRPWITFMDDYEVVDHEMVFYVSMPKCLLPADRAFLLLYMFPLFSDNDWFSNDPELHFLPAANLKNYWLPEAAWFHSKVSWTAAFLSDEECSKRLPWHRSLGSRDKVKILRALSLDYNRACYYEEPFFVETETDYLYLCWVLCD